MGPILAIDPGPTASGYVVYVAGGAPRALRACAEASIEELLAELERYRADGGTQVVCERVSAGRVSGKDILQTCEIVGRIIQACHTLGLPLELRYRREVLHALGVGGGASKDSLVRGVVLELHPGGCGTKRAPGPLYGVSSHAWQALGLACAFAIENDLYRKEST